MKHNLLYASIFLFLSSPAIVGYGLPAINLGTTNFLEGGPIRPNPGWYFSQYTKSYYSNHFLDHCGNEIADIKKPDFRFFSGASQFVYQCEEKSLFHAEFGVDIVLPYVMYSHIEKTEHGLYTQKGGIGDLAMGLFVQWDPIKYKERPLFVHRAEFVFSVPTGKFDPDPNAINPGVGFVFMTPYWSATFYITELWTLSWRLNYLWCSKNSSTQKQAGDAFFMNYSMAYQCLPGLHIGVNGYFLRQLHNNKLCNVPVPHTKEQTFSIGPGFVYFFNKDLIILGHLYFEMKVRNRPQGISSTFQLVWHFSSPLSA